MKIVRYTERPDLWANSVEISHEVWPEYNQHGEVMNIYWERLFEEFPGYQFVLYEDQVLGEGHTVPCHWDGTPEGLGEGIDAMMIAAFEAHEAGRRPNTLCALAAEIRPRFQGRGLARQVIDAMAEIARANGLTYLIAPVRPTFKDRYPITPIERYVTWTNEGGEAYDPWIRVHLRHGGQIVKPVAHSLRITGTVAEWELWTGLHFPDDGSYTFPGGLAPLEIDRKADAGTYWEPNVWIVHAVENSS
jgi:GNAT superfamily N-acetyltransferase